MAQKVHSGLKPTRCGLGTSSCRITAYVRHQCRQKKKKKDLEVIRKGRAQFVPEVRGEHKKLGSGVIACSSHELSSYVGYMITAFYKPDKFTGKILGLLQSFD